MGKLLNKIRRHFDSMIKILRSNMLYNRRFRKCGKRVIVGRLSSIVGGQYIEIGDYCSFGNNLRIEAISAWGGKIHPDY